MFQIGNFSIVVIIAIVVVIIVIVVIIIFTIIDGINVIVIIIVTIIVVVIIVVVVVFNVLLLLFLLLTWSSSSLLLLTLVLLVLWLLLSAYLLLLINFGNGECSESGASYYNMWKQAYPQRNNRKTTLKSAGDKRNPASINTLGYYAEDRSEKYVLRTSSHVIIHQRIYSISTFLKYEKIDL